MPNLRMTRSSKQPAGMTLIELMVASALAAMLMVALTGVLRSLVIQQRTIAEGGLAMAWKDRLLEQMRWDLTNARRFSAEPSRLRLVGYGGRDFNSGNVAQRPAEVVYEVIDGNWLVRHEIHLDASTLHNRRSDLVCKGIGAMAIRRLEDSDRPPAVETHRDPKRSDAMPLGAIPDRLRLVLYGENKEEFINEPILLR